jgi:hypothetical protein
MASAPTVQLSHIGGDPATDDLCGGFSPCDAYDYRGDGRIGAEGICFLPPTVDNHLSDPACSAPNRPGLDGFFKLAWCQVDYGTPPNPAAPPTIVRCQDPADWKSLVEDDGFYSSSVRWRRNEASVGDIFRVYVVRGDQMYAHRDLVIDPNLTTPADGYVHAIGYGNEPIKVRINEDFACVKFDTQGNTEQNAATCLISGATSVSFTTDELVTTFNFPDGNPTFLADFEVSECLSLGFDVLPSGMIDGNALVDVPLADCKISLSSEEIAQLFVPAQIQLQVTDERWSSDAPGATPPFELARLNVLQYDEFGLGALPPSSDPGWFGAATSSSAMLRWLDKGLDALAGLFMPEPLYAARGAGWDFTRMSDFQLSVQPVMDHGVFGSPCPSGEPHCLDLGTFDGTDPVVPVSVYVSAPSVSGPTAYPDNHIPVPDARLHFFAESGTISCPSTTLGDYGRGCVPAGDPDLSTDPPSTWDDHVVVITGPDGMATVNWTLGEGPNTLRVVGCGVARAGSEPNPPAEPGADHVWGSLTECTDRTAALTATSWYANGPADGLTPFEPVDTENEAAVYGLPLEFRAATCPTLTVDGTKEDGWEVCAEKTVFTAPLKGPKVEDNAALYTYSDGENLFLGIEVDTNDLGNKIFVSFVESAAGTAADGDEILVIDFGDDLTPNDWHLTAPCVGNNSASLCGAPDTAPDDGLVVGASSTGADGHVFYEFMRPLGTDSSGDGPLAKEDLGAGYGDVVGLKVTVTQGQGGGKGGFVYPDPQGSDEYHIFTIE